MGTTTLRSSAAALGLATALGLAGCGSHDMAGMPDMGHSSSAGSAGSASAEPSPTTAAGTPASGSHNDADVMFAQMMVPHHEQAIQMSDIVLAKDGIDSRVTDLASQIKDAQAPEINQMNGWLSGWGAPAPPSTSMDHHGSGGGTMTHADLHELQAASGTAAAERFLRGMKEHHRGAISMARDEQENGQNRDATQLAQNIVGSQEAEIRVMETLLADL